MYSIVVQYHAYNNLHANDGATFDAEFHITQHSILYYIAVCEMSIQLHISSL